MKLKIQTWGLLFMLIMVSCSSSDDSPAGEGRNVQRQPVTETIVRETPKINRNGR